MALPRHIKCIFLLPVQDLRKDNVFKAIWQKSLKFPSFFCSCLRKHFACEKALLIWNLLLPWFKRKNTLKFLCMSKSQSPDWARPICWALCKWYKLEAWRNLGWSHGLLNSQGLTGQIIQGRLAELTGNRADFPWHSRQHQTSNYPLRFDWISKIQKQHHIMPELQLQ